MTYKHLAGQYRTFNVNPVRCKHCHTEARIITPSGDLLIPHRLHLEQNIACGNCHPGAGHLSGEVAAAKGTVAAKYPTQVMALCLKCHYRNKGKLNCSACHFRPSVTLAHRQPDWGNTHGWSAFKELSECNACHGYTLFLDEKRSDTAAQTLASPADYCRDNVFCADCHQKRPPSHGKSFAHDHAAWVTDSEDDCLVCHKWNFPLPLEPGPRLYCQKCHIYRGWFPVPYNRLTGSELLVKRPGS